MGQWCEPDRPAPRPALRRLLDTWGIVAGYTSPHAEASFRTRDGVRLVGTYLPGPVGPGVTPSDVPAVVVAHGFAGHRLKPRMVTLAERLAGTASVLSIDLRGHGGSQGACSLGDHEALDIRAAAGWLRRRGHGWIGAVGASMGGAAVVRAAGAGPAGMFDAVCCISAPAQWGLRDSPHMRGIGRLLTSSSYRVAAQVVLRIRVARRWGYPAQPVDLAGHMAPTPLLVVHGVDDHFFGPQQATMLYEAATGPKSLWLEPAGFGHAEDGLTPAFCDRLARAVLTVRSTGSWPASGHPRSGPASSSADSRSR